MNPTTWLAIAASFSAIASFAAAWAAYKSNQAARRSHDLHRWSVHGANVHATCAWAANQESFELTVRNDGPGVAYGVYAEVRPATEHFSGVRPKIESSDQGGFDLAPADRQVLKGEWRQLTEQWLKVGLHWTERADDGTERTQSRWIVMHRNSARAWVRRGDISQ
jgi:hypothetical protein